MCTSAAKTASQDSTVQVEEWVRSEVLVTTTPHRHSYTFNACLTISKHRCMVMPDILWHI